RSRRRGPIPACRNATTYRDRTAPNRRSTTRPAPRSDDPAPAAISPLRLQPDRRRTSSCPSSRRPGRDGSRRAQTWRRRRRRSGRRGGAAERTPTGCSSLYEEPLRVPEQVRREHRRRRAVNPRAGRKNDLRRREIDHWLVFGEDSLRLREQPAPFVGVHRSGVLPRQLVDLAFPRCRWRLLPGIPEVERPRTQPKLRITRGIERVGFDGVVDGVVFTLAPRFNHEAWFERHYVDLEPYFAHLLLHQRRRSLAHRVALLGEQRELRRLSLRIVNQAVAVAVLETDGCEQLFRFLRTTRWRLQVRQKPAFVPCGDRSGELGRLAEKDRVDDSAAIDSGGDRVAKFLALQPRPRLRDGRRRIQVEPQHVGRDGRTRFVEQDLSFLL